MEQKYNDQFHNSIVDWLDVVDVETKKSRKKIDKAMSKEDFYLQ